MAPHLLDLPVWAMDLGYPTKIFSTGGRYASVCAGDGPNTQDILMEYPNMTLSWSMSTVTSFAFDSVVACQRDVSEFTSMVCKKRCSAITGCEKIVPEGSLMPKDAKVPNPSIPSSPGHEVEWLECIRTREKPSCNPDYHCRVDISLIPRNLSLKLVCSIRRRNRSSAIRILRRRGGGEMFIRDNADQGPFSLTVALRGMMRFLIEFYDPECENLFFRLIEKCYDVHFAFHRMVLEAGADMTSFVDNMSSPDLVSPKDYRRFALPFQ